MTRRAWLYAYIRGTANCMARQAENDRLMRKWQAGLMSIAEFRALWGLTD